MKKERKVILYIAMSMDGYIARTNGDIDWLQEAERLGEGDNGYTDFYETVDTVIMGRNTYEHILSLVKEYPYPDIKNYVFCRSEKKSHPFIEFINDDPNRFVQKLMKRKGKNIWLVGGAELVNSFLKENLVDEMIITVIPILLGEGIPLFKEGIPENLLSLKRTAKFGEFVQLQYALNEAFLEKAGGRQHTTGLRNPI
ncbi:dihydrofolate reductase [Mesobacillus foraminis]|uniref:dihydrofolate reductase family protein n=1 Tax=Mesobacillus foraminis TaxID=279826 RepID=UPI001BE7CEA6|nr:dihydrofolate reductase family protein [Mesobacillus foraminis]MBT2755426.1 dihydrofolate reductase [Mesobacillus foraminis]